MRLRRLALFLVPVFAVAAGCGQQSGAPISPTAVAPALVADGRPLLGGGKIQHVVIIFQENRSTDNLFNGLPGADTVRSGKNSRGQTVDLQPILLTGPYDISHKHTAFETEYNRGKIDGFNHVVTDCKRGLTCPPPQLRAYAYVPQYEVQPYFVMAESYAFADRMFQTNQGPSFPAHQYILSGTSTISNGSSLRASENPYTRHRTFTGGCDSPKGSHVRAIDPRGRENHKVYPCFERKALMDLVNDRGDLTWHYYQEHVAPGLWSGPDAIRHIRFGPQYATDVVAPSAQVLTDIAEGNLANMVWITPSAAASDHAGITNGTGPSWVASVVNAIGTSRYWDNTAIFLTWDDWGGWFDHVKPPAYNSYELGFRVPLVVISAYTPQGYVSHKQHEFGSILKFSEKVFGLGSLGTTDVRADDLSDCFDFNQPPRPFTTIPAKYPPSYFLRLPPSDENPDDDD